MVSWIVVVEMDGTRKARKLRENKREKSDRAVYWKTSKIWMLANLTIGRTFIGFKKVHFIYEFLQKRRRLKQKKIPLYGEAIKPLLV